LSEGSHADAEAHAIGFGHEAVAPMPLASALGNPVEALARPSRVRQPLVHECPTH
jgi:hypothetical protein